MSIPASYSLDSHDCNATPYTLHPTPYNLLLSASASSDLRPDDERLFHYARSDTFF